MSDAHGLALTTVNIGAPDPGGLARFYQCLLGGEIAADGPDDVFLRGAAEISLSFQRESGYVRPVWPAEPGDQQMMIHLEIRVDDLERAGAHATACGAVIADHQPQDDVRVYLAARRAPGRASTGSPLGRGRGARVEAADGPGGRAAYEVSLASEKALRELAHAPKRSGQGRRQGRSSPRPATRAAPRGAAR